MYIQERVSGPTFSGGPPSPHKTPFFPYLFDAAITPCEVDDSNNLLDDEDVEEVLDDEVTTLSAGSGSLGPVGRKRSPSDMLCRNRVRERGDVCR